MSRVKRSGCHPIALAVLSLLLSCAPLATFPPQEPTLAEEVVLVGYRPDSSGYLLASVEVSLHRAGARVVLKEYNMLERRPRSQRSLLLKEGALAGAPEGIWGSNWLRERLLASAPVRRAARGLVIPQGLPDLDHLTWRLALGARRSGRADLDVVDLPSGRRVALEAGLPVGEEYALRSVEPSPDGRFLWVEMASRNEGSPRTTLVRLYSVRAVTLYLHNQEAIRLHGQKDYRGALRELTLALDIAPRDGLALYNAACARALLGDKEEAMEALSRALAVDPERYGALAAKDPDLMALRGEPAYRGLIIRTLGWAPATIVPD